MASFVARVGTRPRTIDPESSTVAQQTRMTVLGTLRSATQRGRRYLSADEVDKLVSAARSGRHGVRDATLLLLAYRHDLPLSDLLSLRWEQVDFKHSMLRTGGLRGAAGTSHLLRERELSGLRKLARDYAWFPHVFCAENGAPLSGDAVCRIVAHAGEAAKLGFAVHPRMLRHACGLKPSANVTETWRVQQYLGHRTSRRSARFNDSARRGFADFWKA